MVNPLNYAQTNRETHLAELIDFLKIPSISTQPAHNDDIRAAAQWLVDACTQAGLENAHIHETDKHPIVYADWLHAGPTAPTALIYGHYDVQPADPLELWISPPFAPAIRDDYLYARGATDDKGQLYIHIKAVEAYLKTNGRLPINVKFVIEGEEEIGGASLTQFVAENKALLQADVAVVSDTPFVSKGVPSIVYGLRGMSYALLDITGPTRDLHSGGFGGAIDNPLNVLGHIIAKLKDENGRILIPGFYDKVRPLSDDERAILAQYPIDEATVLDITGAPQIWGEADYNIAERLGARPTLDVHGIIGGYTGPGAKTVLPSKVHAKISMRLVPDQNEKEIYKLFANYVRQIAPPTVTVEVSEVHGARATITDYTIPAIKAAASAYTTVFGKEPIFKREGGSIPVVSDFQQHLGIETVLMGFGLPGDNLHAPNERFYIPNFYGGIETAVHFLANYATAK